MFIKVLAIIVLAGSALNLGVGVTLIQGGEPAAFNLSMAFFGFGVFLFLLADSNPRAEKKNET